MSKYKIPKSTYNQQNKNLIRNRIIDIINKYKIDSILTLESPEFLFSKQLPDKKIIVFEKDKKIFNSMKKVRPKNVQLFYGDVCQYASLNGKVDCIYLDFTSNFVGVSDVLCLLKEVINGSKLFVITLALWEAHAKEYGDYQFALISKLQNLFNLKVIYGKSYKDTMPMVTMIFEVIR